MINVITPTDLEKTLASYHYDTQMFYAFEHTMWQRMATYAGNFGWQMIEHLNRTAIDVKNSMIYLGYTTQIAHNIGAAYRFHDVGKVLQPAHLWGLDDKPTPDIKEQRKEHTSLGARVLEETLKDFPELASHPHITVMACLMKYHHERIDGSGPHGLKTDGLGTLLEIAGIIDCLDGKSLLRPKDKTNIPSENLEKTLTKKRAAFLDMTGLSIYTDVPEKHHGEFRTDLLLSLAPYYERTLNISILPPIARAPQELAL